MVLRPEVEADRPGIRAVNLAAFETPLEAELVDALRSEGASVISLVAEEVGEVIGHIMFSPVTLDRDPGIRLLGLGPMAVLPNRQKSGIGSRLVAEGLLACREQGYDGVVVLGHPDYYPRFGFSAAAGFGLHSEYEVPDEVFMALELVSGSLGGDPRTVRYAPSFSSG